MAAGPADDTTLNGGLMRGLLRRRRAALQLNWLPGPDSNQRQVG